MQNLYPYPILNTDWNSIHLEILENALFTGDSTWFYPNVISPFNRMYFVIDGEVQLENAHRKWTLHPGHIYLIPATSCYTYSCSRYIHKFYIHFNLELLPGVDLFSPLHHFLDLSCPTDLFDTIFSELKSESLSGLFHLKSILWEIIHTFYVNEIKDTDYLQHFKGFYRQKVLLTYLSAHLHAGLRIQDIAKDLNLPEHQLSRSFRKDTGQGLKEYMEKLLLQKAHHLLLHTHMPVYAISEELGFSDPFYFSRFFKKAENLSPREYRKQRI